MQYTLFCKLDYSVCALSHTVKNFFGSCTLPEVLLQVPAKVFMGAWYERFAHFGRDDIQS